MKAVLRLMLGMILMASASCSSSASQDLIWRDSGTYPLEGLEETRLKISVSESQLVEFELLKRNESVSLENTGASDYHRWFFMWDETERLLWFCSSDIGVSVYRVVRDSVTRTYIVRAEDWEGVIPENFIKAMPNSLRKAFLEEAETDQP